MFHQKDKSREGADHFHDEKTRANPGEPPPEDNKIIKRIREITGVTGDFEFLVGDMEQKVGIMIASGDYPDLIGPGQARGRFLNADSFVALDDYLPKYP